MLQHSGFLRCSQGRDLPGGGELAKFLQPFRSQDEFEFLWVKFEYGPAALRCLGAAFGSGYAFFFSDDQHTILDRDRKCHTEERFEGVWVQSLFNRSLLKHAPAPPVQKDASVVSLLSPDYVS